ncbi:MAG: SDR family oxidoreductase [Planctomycetales bacterium]|nr:SDR family oxidoreductase [Planctomycetales bacterium]MCA9166634.1 SDR family oxidoreductase [Planctomycetales bacterium]
MENQFDVTGKVVVITGGTGVLGAALAQGLAAQGARVAVLGRSADKGGAVVASIRDAGHEADFFAIDVTNKQDCGTVADAVANKFGSVDALINAAGGNHPDATATPGKSFFDLDDAALRYVMDLNALGTILPCQAFGRWMADQKSGSIVNISSMAALQPLTRVVGYAASKAAVTNFTQWLSVYMCQHVGPGVRVNAVAPGFFLTEQNRFLLTERETGDLTDRGRTIIQHTPMGRFGEPDELLGAVQWLLSSAAKFVTGIVVPVDGGFSAFSGV